jgi:magnesium-protoporphyrin O-methyltransferase
MPDSCCRPSHPLPDYDAEFDEESVRRDLLEFRRDGADGTTRRLARALVEQGVRGATLLDIGGGVGALQFELLGAGVAASVDVDASAAYLEAASGEAAERGLREQTAYRHGDFVELAAEIEPADVVTLHRVICCYPDAVALVSASASHARRLYGLVYPVDRWWTRILFSFGNLASRLTGNAFRIHLHPTSLVDRLVREAGLEPRYRHVGWIWQTAVYARPAAPAASLT